MYSGGVCGGDEDTTFFRDQIATIEHRWNKYIDVKGGEPYWKRVKDVSFLRLFLGET